MFNEEGTVEVIACLSDSAALAETRSHVPVACPYREPPTPDISCVNSVSCLVYEAVSDTVYVYMTSSEG
jgi:hypothetical protein